MRSLVLLALVASCSSPQLEADANPGVCFRPADGLCVDAGVELELLDSCARRCDLALSCDELEAGAYPMCLEDCLTEWAQCEALEQYDTCVGEAVDVCAAACDCEAPT